MTATLHIEHAISDPVVWRAAFDRFAPARRAAGVRGERIAHPEDDPHRIALALDFDTETDAERFLVFLRTHVWSTPDASPALVGTPEVSIASSPPG